ncbi:MULTISPECIES: hypothetical protein [Streptomyces]|uniref:Uncharacterized protein n=1 Tax=Streptomyces solicathayae TaxID=3081768 RepID=A0ABZ0M318_9ACTN|nr:hypothetical protein [Streptomyces sp. HUAS YS2]WOX26058.1 hypothetical protein R2D22_33605 [Streptomyces sp. HUAS YS2]
MRDVLTHEGSAFINFRDHPFASASAHGYRWVDVKRLRMPAAALADRALLAALIGHEQFRDDYAGGGVTSDGTRHGPYWLSRVTPEAYEHVGADEAARSLWEWANQYETVPAGLAAELRREAIDRWVAADRVYRLSGLGEEDFHDWGGVHGEFHEFVAVDRKAGRVTVLVAADD